MHITIPHIYIYCYRTHSRTSTTSSEEVTYTFGSRGEGGRDSPHSNSPTDGGYLSFRKDSQGYPDTDRTKTNGKGKIIILK